MAASRCFPFVGIQDPKTMVVSAGFIPTRKRILALKMNYSGWELTRIGITCVQIVIQQISGQTLMLQLIPLTAPGNFPPLHAKAAMVLLPIMLNGQRIKRMGLTRDLP